MMAAVQPFLSGAISKTINMPEESTVEDIMQAYIESWKLGLKAVAIYRDNSKCSQPLSAAGAGKAASAKTDVSKVEAPRTETVRAESAKVIEGAGASPAAQQAELFTHARRRKLQSERQSITHKFSVGGHEGYITVGMYEDKTPGEIFIKMAKEGSTLSGFMDGFALSVSIGLQYGVPLKALVDKLINSRFEPSGYTGHPSIPYAKSVLDYIARWLGGRFISADYLTPNGTTNSGEAVGSFSPAPVVAATAPAISPMKEDPPPATHRGRSMYDGAPTCPECGMLMTPNGACYKCENCGGTSGCS
jgi:ribonucleoside-diphosphate reductase alpha chain